MTSTHFLHIPRKQRASLTEASAACSNRRRLHFSRFVLTISQSIDGINFFLQLFIPKLRTCSFCLLPPCILPVFWSLHTIRYFLTDFLRNPAGFFPIFHFFARLPIGGKCAVIAQSKALRGSFPGFGTVALATEAPTSCILQEGRMHPSSFFAPERKRSTAVPCSLPFTGFSAGILSARRSRPGDIPPGRSRSC